jgi:hypothetical protein
VVEVLLLAGDGWHIHHADARIDVGPADRVTPDARILATDGSIGLGATASDLAIRIERADLPGWLGVAGFVSATLTAGVAVGLTIAPSSSERGAAASR